MSPTASSDAHPCETRGVFEFRSDMTDRIRVLTAHTPNVTVTGQKPARRRQRQPSLAGAIAQACKAGLVPTGAIVTAGSVSLEFGSNAASTLNNDDNLDTWIKKHARQTEGH
jgi:hypothetical protein